MFSNKGSKPQNRIDCLIGAGTTVEGNVIFGGGLRVDGHVRGNIIAQDGKPGTLVVSEQARVEGEIRVPHVVMNGAVVGPGPFAPNTLNCRQRPMSQGMSITIRSRCSWARSLRDALCTRPRASPTRWCS